MSDWSDEETDNPLLADDCNYYEVEKWTRGGSKVDRMLYAGNNLERAKDIFAEAVKQRPRIKLTIRQRTRVLEQWPKQAKLMRGRFTVKMTSLRSIGCAVYARDECFAVALRYAARPRRKRARFYCHDATAR
jgi:hypothetical protein